MLYLNHINYDILMLEGMMKKRNVLFLIIAIFVLMLIMLFNIRQNISTNYSDVLEKNWGISLPSKANYKEIYEKNSGISFLGDGIRYHVFSYENEEYIDLMFEWNDNERRTIYNSSYIEASNHWLNEIDVSIEYYPNYDDCLYWYKSKEDNSEIIIFWNNKKKELYIVESFM